MAGRTLASALFATLGTAGALLAQAPTVEVASDLPFATKRVIDTALDAPDASVWTGDTVLVAGSIHEGSAVQVGGTLILEGRVTGDVTAIDAEVYVRPGARVDGDFTILGGALSGTSMDTIVGRETWLRGEPVVAVRVGPDLWRIERAESDLGFPFETKGVAGITVDDYNGVDGLVFGLVAGLKKLPGQPRTELTFGPVFRSGRSDVGWRVAALREFPQAGGIVVGGSFYRVTDSPERWHRGDFSNSMAALFFGDDDRTYHEKTGGEAWVERTFRPAITVRGRFVTNEYESLESVTPWAVIGSDEDWPENPEIEEGSGRAVGGSLIWDRRNDPDFSTGGWWVEGRYDHWGLGGDFEFDWAQGDARAWLPLPVGGGSFIGLRAMGGGSLTAGDSLAPQFWYRLGGGSTIPGYDAATPDLIGDRMAFVTGTLHLGIPGGEMFDTVYVVGLGSYGDAWFDGQSFDGRSAAGGGVAVRDGGAYVGVFGAYGIDSEEWQVYLRISPWF